jgi:enoyl-[acyl-carrier protein] reductase III
MPLLFDHKLVLVTGGGRGIGRAIALHFAHQGADVALNFFRHRAAAEATAAEIQSLGRRALLLKADLGDLDALAALFQQVAAEFGGLDFLIHNAASGYNRPALAQKPKGWDWTLNINARALLFAAQHAVPLMEKRGGGAIVSLSSPGARRVLPDYIVVGASKAALEAVTRHLAAELAPRRITVNAVAPGVVATTALQHFATLQHPATLAAIIANTPAGRLVTPEDVAGLVAFLCTPAAAMLCGQVITLDGGYSLTMPGMAMPGTSTSESDSPDN